MSVLTVLFNVIAPITAIASIGAFWRIRSIEFPQAFTGSLVANITAPCLVISAMTKIDLEPAEFSRLAAASVSVLGLATSAALISVILLRSGRVSVTPALIFGNSGNLGLSVCLFALGPDGLALATIYFVISFGLSALTVPFFFSEGLDWRTPLKAPIVWAAVCGAGIFLTGVNVPVAILNLTSMLGAVTIPLMLISLGYTVATINTSHIFDALPWAALRLVIGLSAGGLVWYVFKLPAIAGAVILLQSSMPTAVFNYIFAQKFNKHPQLHANIIVLSTTMYLFILPVLLAILSIQFDL